MSRIHALLEPKAPQLPYLPDPVDRERLRKLQGLTQAQIAEALGVTPGAVASWEKGRNDPRGRNRAEYAELLRLIAERHAEGDQR